MIVSTTERLILRHFKQSDADCFYRLNAMPEVLEYTGDLPFESVTAAATFITTYAAYQKTGMGRWTIELRQSQLPIGWCGLKQHKNGMVDLGYRLLKNYWGQGIATEASEAVLAIGFNALNLNEIVGRSAFANKASIRVLEKIGMKFWKNAPCDGIQDAAYYRILKSEYLHS